MEVLDDELDIIVDIIPYHMLSKFLIYNNKKGEKRRITNNVIYTPA
jgi:hypothetical protein